MDQVMQAQTQGMKDDDLARALQAKSAQGESCVLVCANKFTSRLFSATSSQGAWLELGHGDIGDETGALLEAAAKRRKLYWLSAGAEELQRCEPNAQSVPILGTSAHLRAWRKERDKVTGIGGRQGEVSPKTRFEVATAAAWRCQFDGCGEDLRNHLAPGAFGNYSYFAHIVAASVDGPRGNAVDSMRLADDPKNIMLMCDRCHRLIDRVAPGLYSADVLTQMRERNVSEVRKLLDTLRYPAVQTLVIGGNIEGQSSAFDERASEEAMWLRKLRAGGLRPEWFARHGGHLGASNSSGYWLSLFELLRNEDLPRLKGLLKGNAQGGAPRAPLAIFALHGTSVLVLTGRLIGESSTTHLFQFHRDQITDRPGGQWAWPAAEVEPPSEKFKLFVRRPASGETEALLQINLTAQVPASDLPEQLFANGQLALPTVEITTDSPSHRVISHPHDLEIFGRTLDQALTKLQDEWRVNRVHLVVIAPTTACLRIGQKMQARRHALFILYERLPGATTGQRGEFVPTISISPIEVTLLSTGMSISIV